MATTGGRGVDVVLNSLADEFIDRSFRVLGPDGRFVEIGKGGIWTTEQMAAVRPDVAYFPLISATCPVDDAADADGPACGDRRRAVAAVAAAGFALDEAMRSASWRRHGTSARSCSTARVASRPFELDATYVVTGGFGALGAAVARSRSRGGAPVTLSWSAGVVGAMRRPRLVGLEKLGARVTAMAADVPSSAAVASFGSLASDPPVRGIIHAAGMVDDGLLRQQSWEQFETVLAPKVMGAWNLHGSPPVARLISLCCSRRPPRSCRRPVRATTRPPIRFSTRWPPRDGPRVRLR